VATWQAAGREAGGSKRKRGRGPTEEEKQKKADERARTWLASFESWVESGITDVP